MCANTRPKNSTAPGPRPRFEIPGSATARCPWLSCALIWVMLIVGQNSLEVILKMDGKL